MDIESAGRKFRPLEIDRVIVAAQGELPFLFDSRPASGFQEIFPWNPALDRPAFILIAPFVERSAQDHLGVDVEIGILDKALKPPAPARGRNISRTAPAALTWNS